jgi:site-specific DNA recombinase
MTLQHRAALYTRTTAVSYRDHAAQIALLRHAAARAGWQVVEVYTDNGYSGHSLVRPALDRLREDARRGRFNAVLVLSPDYLTLDPDHRVLLLNELSALQIHIVYPEDAPAPDKG